MTPLFVTFKIQKITTYNLGDRVGAGSISDYVGTGMLLSIRQTSTVIRTDGSSEYPTGVVVDLVTGELCIVPLANIKVPVRDGKMIGPESPTNPIGISLGNNGTGNGIKG